MMYEYLLHAVAMLRYFLGQGIQRWGACGYACGKERNGRHMSVYLIGVGIVRGCLNAPREAVPG